MFSSALAEAVARLRRAVRPTATITPPPPGVVIDRDVAVTMRDGVTLRVNVYRPVDQDSPLPVLMSMHPYGKDAHPRTRGRKYSVPFQLRLMQQAEPFSFSAWTTWEAPDPGFWVPHGYVVVNCDMRGFGRSEGVDDLLSLQESEDYYDLIEWAGKAEWSNGKVGLNGVSYLALTQWGAAALRPPHLAAICPWEGFTDAYRDFAMPGGIAERGFVRVWSAIVSRKGRVEMTLSEAQREHPLCDDWWDARTPDLEKIAVPALICGSFSDQSLHTRGSFEGFRRIASDAKWLYTHRSGKWSTYYSLEALEVQRAFFDHFLRGDEISPSVLGEPVRIEVRGSRDQIADVVAAREWPPEECRWETLWLDPAAAALLTERPAISSEIAFRCGRGRASFRHIFGEQTTLAGPMRLRIHVEAEGTDDLTLFVAVRKFDTAGREICFQGSFGYQRDVVTKGWMRASLRATDEKRFLSWLPFHEFKTREPLRPGEVVPVDVELMPSATLFRAGESARLDIQSHWLFRRNPLTGNFPAWYERNRGGRCRVHGGGEYDSQLLIPVLE